MMTAIKNWLFGPSECETNIPERAEKNASLEGVREAQQRFTYSTLVASAIAHQSGANARQWTKKIKGRVDEKSVTAAQQAADIVRGRDHVT